MIYFVLRATPGVTLRTNQRSPRVAALGLKSREPPPLYSLGNRPRIPGPNIDPATGRPVTATPHPLPGHPRPAPPDCRPWPVPGARNGVRHTRYASGQTGPQVASWGVTQDERTRSGRDVAFTSAFYLKGYRQGGFRAWKAV